MNARTLARMLALVVVLVSLGPAIPVSAQEAIAAPSNLSASGAPGDPNTLVVSWQDNSNNEDGFKVLIYKTDGTFSSGGNTGGPNITTWSYYVGCNTTWNIVVYAWKYDGSVSSTAEIHDYYLPCTNFQPTPTPVVSSSGLIPPTGLWPHASGDGYYLVIEWQDNSDSEDGYAIHVESTDGGNFNKTENVPANTTFVTYYVACGYHYSVSLYAFKNSGGDSATVTSNGYYHFCPTAAPPVQPTATNVPPPPPTARVTILKAPGDLKAYPGSNPDYLVVRWIDYSDNEDGYTIHIETTDGTVKMDGKTGPDGWSTSFHVGCGKIWNVAVYAFRSSGEVGPRAELNGYYHFCPYTKTPTSVPPPTLTPVPTNDIAANMGFRTGNIIQIGYPVYVIVDGKRRHVPNPETLNALGISRTQINNRGYSEADLSQIPEGIDIPDVNRDANGFKAFKDTYFPNSQPIQSGKSLQPTLTPLPRQTPKPNPTAVPQPTSAPQGQSSQEVSSNWPVASDAPPSENLWDKLFGVLAAGEKNGWIPRLPFKDEQECVGYVGNKRCPDSLYWLDYNAYAYKWVEMASSKKAELLGVSVHDYPQEGDIAVWQPGCGNTNATYGHVALVTLVHGNLFDADGSNWDGTHKFEHKDGIQILTCMKFIRNGCKLQWDKINPPQPPTVTNQQEGQSAPTYPAWLPEWLRPIYDWWRERR